VTRLAGLLGLLIALVWAPLALAAAGPQFPALTGRVVDDAHVLSPDAKAELTGKLAALEQKNSRQLVVVTLPTLGGYEIEDYGYQLLRHWGVGQKGLNNGAIFIIVPSEHKVRVEVGYGLEATLTDAMSSVILQRYVIPKFRAGDVQAGVLDGAAALIEQLGLDPSAAETKAAEAAQPVARHHRHGNPIAGLIPLVIIFFVFTSIFRGRGGGGAWVLPLLFMGGSRGRDDDWGGGGGWGGGGDGGGFSGGGGSGGGGGASGSW
jgi:uncharacterized protein